ncbi:MAG: type II secretion system protein, partial [Kiritimatiellae bacterium]|nr:type II secretion system protein [Kiritimatiellia bacterium]
MFCKSKKAFTLIEMMAVLAIIGILLGLVVTAVSGSMKASR